MQPVAEEGPEIRWCLLRSGIVSHGKEAIADIEDAIWNDPKLAKAYSRLGQLHEEAGNDDKALTDYGQAIELDPIEPAKPHPPC